MSKVATKHASKTNKWSINCHSTMGYHTGTITAATKQQCVEQAREHMPWLSDTAITRLAQRTTTPARA